MRFLTALRQEFGEGRFSSRDIVVRLAETDLPSHVRNRQYARDPVRMLGRWLAARVGWGYRGLTFQKLTRSENAQLWKFGTLPADEPEPRLMVLDPSGRWYWQERGLWPDEVVK
jgi:predicted chitinase